MPVFSFISFPIGKETFDINFGFLLVQLLNFGLIVAWLVLAALALVKLQKTAWSSNLKMVWSLLIAFLPIFGALAFWAAQKRE